MTSGRSEAEQGIAGRKDTAGFPRAIIDAIEGRRPGELAAEYQAGSEVYAGFFSAGGRASYHGVSPGRFGRVVTSSPSSPACSTSFQMSYSNSREWPRRAATESRIDVLVSLGIPAGSQKSDKELPALKELVKKASIKDIFEEVELVFGKDKVLSRNVKMYLCQIYR